MQKRRRFLKIASVTGIAGIAGCTGNGSSGDGGETETTAGGGEETETETETESADRMTFGGDGRVNVGISPSVPQEDLEVQYAPLLDHVESYLTENYSVPEGLSVEGNVGSNYSAIIQSLGEGTTARPKPPRRAAKRRKPKRKRKAPTG